MLIAAGKVKNSENYATKQMTGHKPFHHGDPFRKSWFINASLESSDRAWAKHELLPIILAVI